MQEAKKDPADKLAFEVERLKSTGGDFESQLMVDDRVLARITDGIYRRPSAAIRELIFNAYDADATSVVVDTDYPRFEYISVKDNGNGMDEHSLANLFTHIGGSSKRTQKGVKLGTVNEKDPALSPGGRRIIGKIGIGMFAVTHLTTHFRVITKKANSHYRLIAEVWLKTWTEEKLKEPGSESGEFVTGDVVFSVEPASDVESHGTEIVLLDIRDTTRRNLRYADFWEMYAEAQSSTDPADKKMEREAPSYHVGYSKDGVSYLISPVLPWKDTDLPADKFQALYKSVVSGTGTSTKNPDIEEYLDTYLGMIWMLSLAAPLPYLGGHPLRFTGSKDLDFYLIQNKTRGQAEYLPLEESQSVSEALGLESDKADPCGGFLLLVDGVELKRPVILPDVLQGARKKVRVKRPMLFVGKVVTSLGKVAADLGGGDLEFEAYFYWNSLITPKQNRGVLIRINNASGVLYDDRFMEYQISELNRLSQITAEVFITKGLDPALNIDRESFNISHPHYQYVTKWVHAALRQITNKLKDLGKKSRDEEKYAEKNKTISIVQRHLDEVWERSGDLLSQRPDVFVVASGPSGGGASTRQLNIESGLTFEVDNDRLASLQRLPANALTPLEQVKSVFIVLSAYGLLEELSYTKQQELFKDIMIVLSPEIAHD
ncbi:MAG: ATP-binding protein [Pseudomonadaceae bacterium]